MLMALGLSPEVEHKILVKFSCIVLCSFIREIGAWSMHTPCVEKLKLKWSASGKWTAIISHQSPIGICSIAESPQTSIHGYRPLVVASVRPGSAAQRLDFLFCLPSDDFITWSFDAQFMFSYLVVVWFMWEIDYLQSMVKHCWVCHVKTPCYY